MGRLIRIKIAVLFCCYLVFTAFSQAVAAGENEKAIAGLKQKPPVEEWSFAVLGDSSFSCRMCDWTNEKVLADMSRDQFDFAVHVGDFLDSGTGEEYWGYLDRIGNLLFPIIHIPGNHDVSASNQKDTNLFQKYFGEPYFYFDYQNARFIILNNSAHEFGDGQRAWLDKTLTEAKERLKFVFMHIPTFNPSRRKAYLIKWDEDIEPFEEIVRRHKVDLIFTGHLHFFHDTVHQGVRNIITGGGGDFLYEIPENGGFHHWVKINIKGKSVQAQAKKIPIPFWSETLYRIFFFFNYDIRDNWKVYLPIFVTVIFLLSIFLLKIRRERGKKVN